MFEPFSDHYFVGEMTVDSHTGDTAVMKEADVKSINKQLYSDHQIASVDQSLVMRVKNRHVEVMGEDEVPSRTLALPEVITEEADLGRLPEEKVVYLAAPSAPLSFFQ